MSKRNGVILESWHIIFDSLNVLLLSLAYTLLKKKLKTLPTLECNKKEFMWFVYVSNEKGSNFSQISQNNNMKFP